MKQASSGNACASRLVARSGPPSASASRPRGNEAPRNGAGHGIRVVRQQQAPAHRFLLFSANETVISAIAADARLRGEGRDNRVVFIAKGYEMTAGAALLQIC
ncbi:hypothetical protein [Variovorax boronicumulans]|uniref:hypothetical protein n=1 Tax=Variovorax boronicumulans TaxID=436515 RepID=UPI00118133F2|nr:hypothetical protein [Variovorax boronicumulans]